ncbi:Sugar transporter family protein [Coccidioides posadasii C735 delta SOWgp]|uniref:Sugar transporter family protein n=1 Tax=Coccidioides posadasii (strain C735) TaxID=222929 RepID=C5PC65_COCP7|nr:Sugar transporter family protein [Coccidioides posadasii C735 delta SOWgp]EER25542.1 Sugar transporter family protein [Coccidioides posadasii C735 delta SOWgp]|eukprot:XP_003067687.1 Sugar transporter family protein [Coccidioides posadasii C735 delta SOWgp]
MPNIFKQNLGDTPREALNWKLGMAVLCFGLMGASRGIDEGLIGGTVQQKSFTSKYSLEDQNLSPSQEADKLGNITAMVQIGSIGGALIAFLITDRIGRVWATRQLCLVWAIGIAIYMSANGRLGQVYAGRFIAGIGVGQTTVVGPTYLAEVAPRAIRGLCTCAFSGSVYVAIVVAYFANWGSSLHISDQTQKEWLVPTSVHIVFAGIILILSFGVKESPRYLAKIGKNEEAIATMADIRDLSPDHPYIQTEMNGIYEQLEREREATLGLHWLGPLKELFLMPSNRYRIMVGLMSQLLSQWSGATSITIYAPQFFAMLGTTGQSEKLFATAIFGVVKLVASIVCALFLVDILGRKRALEYGIILQFMSMLYVAIYLAVAPSIEGGEEPQGSAKKAGTAAIVSIYISGVGWALGWNSVQYLINAEIFPLRVRALGTSMVMCFHFANQYGLNKAVPTMLLETVMKPQGTFFFFAAVTLLGFLWMWFFLPETAGKSLKAVDGLFSLPWYVIGRKGAALTATTQGDTSETRDTEKATVAESDQPVDL